MATADTSIHAVPLLTYAYSCRRMQTHPPKPKLPTYTYVYAATAPHVTMAKSETPAFDDLESVDENPDLDDDDVDWFDFDEPGDTIVGELREVKHDCGPNDSRTYKVSQGLGDTTLFWGAGSLNQQYDQSDLEPGDVIGVRLTEDTFENDHGEFPVYDVREME